VVLEEENKREKLEDIAKAVSSLILNVKDKLESSLVNEKKEEELETSIKDEKKELEDSIKNEKETKKEPKKTESDKLEDELDDDDSEEDDLEGSPSLTYGFHGEKFFEEQFYKQAVLDYEKLFYGPSSIKTAGVADEDVYSSTREVEENETDMLSTMEAEGTFMEIQYAAAVGANHDVSLEKRRKFGLWIQFNSAMFRMFETMYTLTSDVNYAG
jgi:hypothetical protein